MNKPRKFTPEFKAQVVLFILSGIKSTVDAVQQLGKFIDDVYTKKLIYSYSEYLTSLEFEQKWINKNLDGILLTNENLFMYLNLRDHFP